MCEFRDEILLRGEKCKTPKNLKFSKSNKKKGEESSFFLEEPAVAREVR